MLPSLIAVPLLLRIPLTIIVVALLSCCSNWLLLADCWLPASWGRVQNGVFTLLPLPL